MSFLETLKKHGKLIKFNLGLIGSFIGFSATNLVVLADGDSSAFEKGLGGHQKNFSINAFANIASGFISPLQTLAAVLLVIFAIWLGIKIGMAAVTSDPRGREGAIVGLFFIIIAGVVVIHAREIVGMAASVDTSGKS